MSMCKTKSYLIIGDPVPLARARLSNSRFFDSQKAHKLNFGLQIQNQHENLPPFTGPLKIDVAFYFPKTKSISLKRWETLKGKPHVYRPDIDNLLKFVLDASAPILFREDCIIAEANCKKEYGEIARTEFTISVL